ncbi:hypothetical protein SBF1_5420003 [Candidatus Desulfosporosinus infrequens]|uniref:Uncharacterized protein n=1 Tax=Candidatus Desulfosporosinus infrequens TaxID=2043169 RepID=A0A2U3LJ29_9FIRM|nr:hypothetical protein SBF1_5420003 [Candidatus Desulfosporosinus infrequens]
MNDPDAWINVLTALKEERAAKERLQLEASENKPKLVFADAVSVSDGTILIGEDSVSVSNDCSDFDDLGEPDSRSSITLVHRKFKVHSAPLGL